jgi:glycosyltransferase involved in cell wall biosynthesis
MWSRGVDTALFHPGRAKPLDLPRPIFMNVGRVAIEKNLDAFLSLDLPGTKVVIGHGPQEAELRARYPNAAFLGAMSGETLAAHLAAADVFVFPSLTDTFGIAQLEALASGVPVAAFPVTGPLDVIGDTAVGALGWDLRQACLDALAISRPACREHALTYSWSGSAGQFLANLQPLHVEATQAAPTMLASAINQEST